MKIPLSVIETCLNEIKNDPEIWSISLSKDNQHRREQDEELCRLERNVDGSCHMYVRDIEKEQQPHVKLFTHLISVETEYADTKELISEIELSLSFVSREKRITISKHEF
jgi:hypothetical protein